MQMPDEGRMSVSGSLESSVPKVRTQLTSCIVAVRLASCARPAYGGSVQAGALVFSSAHVCQQYVEAVVCSGCIINDSGVRVFFSLSAPAKNLGVTGRQTHHRARLSDSTTISCLPILNDDF